MEKARIVNETDFGGTYSTVWLSNNANIVFAGQLVSSWQMTEVLPDGLLKEPKWNGTLWIEGFIESSLVPYQVNNMKFRLALIQSGIMPSQIDYYIDQIPSAQAKERIYTLWNFALQLERADENLNAMASEFNITQQQLDELFISANNL